MARKAPRKRASAAGKVCSHLSPPYRFLSPTFLRDCTNVGGTGRVCPTPITINECLLLTQGICSQSSAM